MRLVIASTHPIQYQAPLFRELSRRFDLTVVFLMRQVPQGQASSGFGVEFEWDVPLLDGYRYVFANNVAKQASSRQRRGIVLEGHESLLASLRPDVVMTLGWFPHAYLQVIGWAHRQHVSLVARGESNLVSGHSLPKRVAKYFYFRHLFAKFQSFAVIGKQNHAFYKHYGVTEDRLYPAPYSVDTALFEAQYRMHRPTARKPGPWRIGFAGKLIPKKRPLDLIAAVDRSKYRGRIQLVIIGDGPMRREMECQANTRNLMVDFRGFLNQSQIVPQGYADLDALVLPSGEYETWGLVVNEVMTGGIPVVVSDLVGCAADLVVEGRTGFVFSSGSVVGLTQKLDELVAQLEAGHVFTAKVREKISDYSIENTARGATDAILGGLRHNTGKEMHFES